MSCANSKWPTCQLTMICSRDIRDRVIKGLLLTYPCEILSFAQTVILMMLHQPIRKPGTALINHTISGAPANEMHDL